MFAGVDMSMADAIIRDTTADPTWVPLITTPPYPEYPSGYNSLAATTTGAVRFSHQSD